MTFSRGYLKVSLLGGLGRDLALLGAVAVFGLHKLGVGGPDDARFATTGHHRGAVEELGGGAGLLDRVNFET